MHRMLLFLLLLTMAGGQSAWAVDDIFEVSNTTGADLIYKGGTAIETGGTYSSLTLGFAADSGTDLFRINSGQNFIGPYDGTTTPNPSFTGNVPTGGFVYIFAVSKPGSFVFDVKLNDKKTIHFRNTSGTDLNVRKNETNANIDHYKWAVEIEAAGTYYLYAEGSKLPLYGYTFTRKVPAGITSLPYHADFSSDIEPFDDGNVTSGTNVSNVYTLNSVAPNSGTAIARFNGIHTLKSTEQVTLSYTAYHGVYNRGGESRVTLYNSNDRPLVSYTYDKLTCKITDVSFNEETADGLQNGIYVQSRNGTGGGNGFGGNGRPYTNNAGDNPVITITINGNGTATFNVTLTKTSVNTTFNGSLAGELIDLAYLKIEDSSDNADRGYGIDNLSITSQLASLDYETEVVDWKTNTIGRFTPVILTEDGNHYLSVKQDERGNNGATLTCTTLSGSVPAGTDYTISFDMKIANTGDNLPSFIIKDAANSKDIFSIRGNTNSTKDWLINGTEIVTLEGTYNYDHRTTNTYIADDLTWYHFIVSKTNGYTYVTITDKAGSTYYLRKGFVNNNDGGLGNLVFNTGKYYSDFAIDNIVVTPYASSSFTLSGKVETYTIMGEGDLPQVEQGSTITLEYGNATETQQTKRSGTDFGAYCPYKGSNDNNTYSTAWTTGSATNVAPGGGTFYKFTPKFNGKLSVLGGMEDAGGGELNDIILRNAAGDVKETKMGSAGDNFAFTTELQAGVDYYLYAATPETGDYDSGKGSKATFFLAGFTFTQSAMNREVMVSDLLYAGEKTSTNLARTIPGMTLAFNNNVTSGTGRDYLNFVSGGTMTITLRQNGYNATVSGVTLVNNGTKLNSGFTVDTSVSGQATITASENLSVSSFIVSYNGTGGESNYKLWLNEDKTDIGTLAVANSHIMRVPGDGKAFTNTITFSGDDANKWWVENTDYLHTSSNTSIATINTDGTNGQLLKSGAATITATFQETDYFNEKSISYTVDNVLRNDGVTYDVDVTTGKILRVGAYADAASTALLLNGSHTSDASFTYGTALEKLYTRATSDGTVTLKNETANNITVNTLQVFSSNVVAWLYYEGQENNYSMQMQFQNFASGEVKGFRVLDIGDAVDPIDLTDAYEWKSGSYFAWFAGTPAWTLSGQFINSNGSFTPNSKEAGDITALPTVSRTLSRKDGVATAYADTYNEITATANIFIATPSDEDSDGLNDTYQKWDLTTTIIGSGQMDSRWTWSNYRRCYQTYLPDYLPILNRDGNSLAGNEGLLVKGTMRYNVGAAALRLNLTAIDAGIKFPVKKGMEVKIEMWSESADVNHLISNVTDVAGNATNKLYTEYATETVTAYFLAEEDNVIELLSMDKIGGHVKSITLQTPHIHFNEEIVTVPATGSSHTNLPYNASTGANLSYSIAGEYTLPTTYNGDGTATTTESIATINNSTGTVTVTGTEGYAIINVVDNNATGIQPKKGSYRLYVIDFQFAPTSYNSFTDNDTDGNADEPDLNLSSTEAKNQNGEALFSVRPVGYDKVVQPVTYTMTYYSGTPRGRLTQSTKTDPRQTTYELSAYSAGTIRVTATTGHITTYCDVVISGGNNFAEIAPVKRLADLPQESSNYYFLNELPAGFNSSYTTYTVDKSGDISCDGVTTESNNAKISNITGSGGALRVTATDNNNTPGDATDDKTATFTLTIAYSASEGKKWDFYRMKHYDDDSNPSTDPIYGLYLGDLGDLKNISTIPSYTVTSHSAAQRWTTGGTWNAAWTTPGITWNRVYRKGDEQERWAVERSMKGDNAFIIEETAGLIIETGLNGFYTDNPQQPAVYNYNHFGIHNNATVTIPQLKKGDYISLNLSRVVPNNGAIISATNAEDLAGNTVDHSFTITRSQTDYSDNGQPAKDATGARVIPGYYTFRAANDGDVSFTLEDEGYLDILSIEIYGKTTEMALSTDAGQGNDPDNGYRYTMTNVKVDDYPTYSNPPTTRLMDTGDTETIDLAICNILWSTSVGPAEYVLLDKKGNLDATFNNVKWFSDGGAGYNKGHITVNGGSYGKMRIRMNNYTDDGRYLIGYTPTYSLTVGRPPHHKYPYTWNFENISGGAVKDNSNNAYNSVSTDYYTWDNYGNYRFGLNTDTDGGSLYVPGATLVSQDRELNNDEFAGLGFTGGLYFQTADGTDAVDEAIESTEEGNLLSYTLNSSNYNEAAIASGSDHAGYWNAGAGWVKFGSSGKRSTSTVAASGAAYTMDGGDSKYILLAPKRPFRNGDILKFKIHFTADDPLCTGSNYGLCFRTEAKKEGPYLANVFLPAGTAKKTETEITYTVKHGDGLVGRSEIYVFRAVVPITPLLSYVTVTAPTGNRTAGVSYGKRITVPSSGSLTITVPDLNADLNANSKQDWIYIKSSVAPSSITNATAAVEADGLDAASGVYKYKVTDPGNSDITFPENATISSIGVTHILKPLTKVGTGETAKGWATESRDCAIDHTRTGFFTVNNVDAKYVTVAKYDIKYANVTLNNVGNYGVPENIGLVLKMEDMSHYSDANTGGVPLFAPAISTNRLTTLGFNGTLGNMMRPNVTARPFYTERETVNAVDADDGVYTRFILATHYMKWKKVGTEAVTHDAIFNEGDVPVFYRLHLYNSTEATALSSTEAKLNTLGANKAYLSLRTANLPDALWKDDNTFAKGYIGISGISDFTEYSEDSDVSRKAAKAGTYNISGQKISDEAPLPAGIYIKDGRKVVVK